MSCCETYTIRPGGAGVFFVDFGDQESIFQDGLSLAGTPTVTFNPNTTPPGGSTSPNFAPTLGPPAILTPATQPSALGMVNSASGIGSVTINSGGNGWPPSPAKVWCTFTGGGGWGAVGIATVSQGEVVSVRMAQQGANYSSPPTAVFHTAVISFLVTTSPQQDGFTYTVECFCNLSDGVQNVVGEGRLLVSW